MVKSLEQYLGDFSFSLPTGKETDRKLTSGEQTFVEKYLGMDMLRQLPVQEPQAEKLPPLPETRVAEKEIFVAPPKLVVAPAKTDDTAARKQAVETPAPATTEQKAGAPVNTETALKTAAPAQTKIQAPVQAPVKAPVQTTVQTQVRTVAREQVKIKAPVQAPAQTQVKAPVEAPVQTPIQATVQTQVQAPVQTQTQTRVQAQVKTPAQSPVSAPVRTKAQAPVETQIKTQVKAPAETGVEAPAPVGTQTKAPVETSAKTRVAAPVQASVTQAAATQVSVEQSATVKTAAAAPAATQVEAEQAVKISLRDSIRQQAEVQMVSFFISGQIFLIPIECIQEVLRHMELIKVPQAPPFVAGVINLRGKVTPLVHLAEILTNEGKKAYDSEKHFIIICGSENLQIGLIIDKINSMHMLPQDKIIWNVESKLGEAAEFICALANLNEKVCGIVDPDMITQKILAE